jgi:hypothetical protein
MAVGIFRGTDQLAAFGKLRQPFPCDGQADTEQHLIASEHLAISHDS